MEQDVRENLAAAYQIFAMQGLDDLTYTHLSARVPGEDAYYIYPFGVLFEEVTASKLIKVTLEGEVIEGSEYQYNITGYNIHGSIYNARPEINAIFHLHSMYGVAVSCQKRGLLPISQFALHFYEQVAYHGYSSLTLESAQGDSLIQDLGDKKVAFLTNHGTLTCGSTIHEAAFYMHHLEQACKVQCLSMSAGSENVIELPHEVCKKANNDLLGFEEDIGKRDWVAWINKLDRNNIKFRE